MQDYILKDLTTSSKEALHGFYILLFRKNDINAIDFKVAFSQGENIRCELLVLTPMEVSTGKILL